MMQKENKIRKPPIKIKRNIKDKNLCTCANPYNVHNGVCGKCLLPLDHSARHEGGRLVCSSD